MARLFDPTRERNNFDRFLLQTELSRTAAAGPVSGSAAIQRLGTVIRAWLVGLRGQIDPVLRDCHAALKRSIETREPLGDVFIPAVRSSAFGMSHWMLNNDNDTATWLASLDHFDSYFQQGGQKVIDPDFFNPDTQRFEPKIQRGLPISDEEILNGYLADYLAGCIQSEQYERGVSLYEKVGAEKDMDPARMTKVTEFGYWVCRENRLSGKIPTDAYLSVGERILKRHLQSEWLGQGRLLTAATWLKVLYWHSGVTASPLEAILKAYDLMPDVPRPAFL